MSLMYATISINSARVASEPTATEIVVYKVSDQSVQPYLQAINQSNRLSLGFSQIPPDAEVEVYENLSKITEVYIHAGPQTGWGYYTEWNDRLAKVNGSYKWLSEEEIYAGPHQTENIYIDYYTDSTIGPSNIITVKYRGEDSRLSNKDLTLEEVQPIIIEWEKAWATATPVK